MKSLNETLTQIMAAHSASSFEDWKAVEAALMQEKIKTLNETSAPANGYDCPHCRNKGVIFRLNEATKNFIAVPCKCTATRRCLARMRESGLGNALERLTFDSFQAEEPWQERLLKAARAYAQRPQGWLTMLGQSGCGKTHLCTAVCGELLRRGEQVLYFSWREEAARLKAATPEHRAELMDNSLNAPYLYIDDLLKTGRGPDGTIQPTAGDLNLAFTILNHRYSRSLPTILSSELGIAELLRLDEALGSRIAERSGVHLCAVRRDPSRNYRLRSVREV